MAMALPVISEELSGKHILVTGGSGFMGKVLLEKLMRSCPDIACIYLLLRPKRGVTAQDRIQNILATPLFGPLLRQRPAAAAMLRAVAGDCSLLRLGLSAEDEALLVDTVSYVFHVAATVRFDDPLKSAIILNARGTREVVELCKRMKHLKVLEYVSTTYCFTREPLLQEKHYPTDIDWRTVIRVAETEDQHVLNALSHKVLDFQPNSYTFSKAVAENIINDCRNSIPAIIFRPAVVLATVNDPFPGWLDNLNGPFGIWAGALKGVLRFTYCEPSVALACTPVDWAVRGMIVCAVAKACESEALCSTPGALDVVNMEASKYDSQTFHEFSSKLHRYCVYGTNPVRYPRNHVGKCYPYYWLGCMLSELPYGLAIDALLLLTGKKPRMVSVYRKKFHANESLAYFMFKEFPTESNKLEILHGAIRQEEHKAFGLLSGEEYGLPYNLELYYKNTIKGAFKYIFHEESTLEQNRRRLFRLYVLEIVLNVLWVCFICLTLGTFFLRRVSRLELLTI